MIEDEFIKIWQSSNNQERIKFEKSKLMIELQSSLGYLHRWWHYLELGEVSLAVIGILLSCFLAYIIPVILLKVVMILIAILAIYLTSKYQGIKKYKPNDLEENYLEYLKKNRKYLEAQKNFLKTYINWGILPVYPIMLLFVIGIWNKVSAYFILIIFINVAAIIIGGYGYFLNQKRVKKKINPRLKKIDTLIKLIEED